MVWVRCDTVHKTASMAKWLQKSARIEAGVVTACNVNFDDQGMFINVMDAGWIESMVNHLVRYIRKAVAPTTAYTTRRGPSGENRENMT